MTTAEFTRNQYFATKAITTFYFKRLLMDNNPHAIRDLHTFGKWRDRETIAWNVYAAHSGNGELVDIEAARVINGL